VYLPLAAPIPIHHQRPSCAINLLTVTLDIHLSNLLKHTDQNGEVQLLVHTHAAMGSIFRYYGSYDPQISGWLILFMLNVVLMGMGSTLKTDTCAINNVITCRRQYFGIAIGLIVGILSFVAILLVACSTNNLRYQKKLTASIVILLE